MASDEKDREQMQYTGIGVALGAGVGSTIGVLVGGSAIAMGLAVGAGLGVAVGAAIDACRACELPVAEPTPLVPVKDRNA